MVAPGGCSKSPGDTIFQVGPQKTLFSPSEFLSSFFQCLTLSLNMTSLDNDDRELVHAPYVLSSPVQCVCVCWVRISQHSGCGVLSCQHHSQLTGFGVLGAQRLFRRGLKFLFLPITKNNHLEFRNVLQKSYTLLNRLC